MLCFDTVLTWVAKDRHAANESIDLLVIDEAQDTSPLDACIYDQFTAATRVIIGDPNQAIYGFRGAFSGWMEQQDAEPMPLTVSFRCCAPVCNVANRLMGGVPKYAPMISHLEHGIFDRLGSTLCRQHIGAHHDNLRAVADYAADAADNGDNTIAILTRYNADLPDIRAALRCAGLDVPLPRCDESERAVMVAGLRALTSWRDAHVVAQWREALPAALLASIKLRWGSVEQALEIDHTSALWPERIAMPAWAADEVARQRWTPSEALEHYLEDTGPQDDRLHVGTIHSAKGGEWDAVAIVGAVRPPGKPLSDEDRRVYYVAVTRARYSLLITGSHERPNQHTGRMEACVPIEGLLQLSNDQAQAPPNGPNHP
jgi:DNA helicase-2/ATP-dependent DNA helicase PcrA